MNQQPPQVTHSLDAHFTSLRDALQDVCNQSPVMDENHEN